MADAAADDDATGWYPDSNLNHLAVADWSVAADGSIHLLAAGPVISFAAVGASSSIQMSAGDSFSVVCGPAVMVIGAGEESAGSGFMFSAGNEGTIGAAAGPSTGPRVTMTPESLSVRIGEPD